MKNVTKEGFKMKQWIKKAMDFACVLLCMVCLMGMNVKATDATPEDAGEQPQEKTEYTIVKKKEKIMMNLLLLKK